MANLTPGQIYELARNAGFGPGEAVTATAIALAESSGNPNSHALTSREDSRGLWQVNVYAHPEYGSVNLYDPAVNARAAHTIYTARGSWRDWSTYTRCCDRGESCCYRNYLGRVAGVDNGGRPGLPGDTAPVPDSLPAPDARLVIGIGAVVLALIWILL